MNQAQANYNIPPKTVIDISGATISWGVNYYNIGFVTYSSSGTVNLEAAGANNEGQLVEAWSYAHPLVITSAATGETITLCAAAVTGTSPYCIMSLNTREEQ